MALKDLGITDQASVSRLALTGEDGNAILTHTMVAWLGFAVIDVFFTK